MHLQELHSLCLDDPLRNLPLWPYLAVAVTPRLMMSGILKTDSHASHGAVCPGKCSSGGSTLKIYSKTRSTHTSAHTCAYTHTYIDMLLREAGRFAFTQWCFKSVFVSIHAVFLFDFCRKLRVKFNKGWYNFPAVPMGEKFPQPEGIV